MSRAALLGLVTLAVILEIERRVAERQPRTPTIGAPIQVAPVKRGRSFQTGVYRKPGGLRLP